MDFNWHLSESQQKKMLWLALGMWGLCAVVVSILVIRHPTAHTDCPVYVQAAQDWWAHRNMYTDTSIDGFLYFPQAAILYTPFELMGWPAGDIGWRLFGWGLLCHAMYRSAKILHPLHYRGLLVLATWIVIWTGLGSLRNGQSNLPTAAIMLEATVCLARRQWWRAVIWMMLGLAIKPIIAVMILLSAALYRPTIWRLLIGFVMLALFPFLTANYHYVVWQYHECYVKLGIAAQPDRLFTDLYSLIRIMGWIMPHTLLVVIQLSGALATLGFCYWMSKAGKEPWNAFLMVTMAAIYLMLLNPRTELSSYIIVAPSMAFAAGLLYYEERRVLGVVLGVVTVAGYTCDGWAFKLTSSWLKQVVCLVFVVLLVLECIARRRKAIMQKTPTVEMAGTA